MCGGKWKVIYKNEKVYQTIQNIREAGKTLIVRTNIYGGNNKSIHEGAKSALEQILNISVPDHRGICLFELRLPD